MLRYDDVAFYHMVMELEKVMPKEMMESSGYLMLKKYEEKHGGDLCRVFLNYILSGRSVTETAQMMFMHRNTVQNKIKKATGIMESDFDSFSEQVFYVISYMNDYIDF